MAAVIFARLVPAALVHVEKHRLHQRFDDADRQRQRPASRQRERDGNRHCEMHHAIGGGFEPCFMGEYELRHNLILSPFIIAQMRIICNKNPVFLRFSGWAVNKLGKCLANQSVTSCCAQARLLLQCALVFFIGKEDRWLYHVCRQCCPHPV